jgi:hypothetical protein
MILQTAFKILGRFGARPTAPHITMERVCWDSSKAKWFWQTVKLLYAAGVEVINMANDSEPFVGYLIVLLADGSVSNQTFEGILRIKKGDTIVGGKGTWKTVNGTGKFANFQGQGSFDWKANGDDYHAEYAA